MAGIQDLLASLSMFKQGVNDYAIGQGIQQAQQEVQQINQSQQSEIQKRQALMDTAQQLTLRLGSLQAPVSQIQSAAGAIAPAPFRTSEEASMQGIMKESPELQAAAERQRQFEQKSPMEKLAAEAASRMSQQRLANEGNVLKIENRDLQQTKQQLLSASKAFNKDAKLEIDALNNAYGAEQLLQVENPFAQQTLRTSLLKAAGEKGVITDKDILRYGGSAALASKLKRYINEQASGEIFTGTDLEQVKQLLTSVKAAKEKTLGDRMQQHAGQLQTTLGGSDSDYMKVLTGSDPKLKTIADTLSGNSTGLASGETVRAVKNMKTGQYDRVVFGANGQPLRLAD